MPPLKWIIHEWALVFACRWCCGCCYWWWCSHTSFIRHCCARKSTDSSRNRMLYMTQHYMRLIPIQCTTRTFSSSYFLVAAQSLNIVKLFINTLDCQHIRIEIFQSKSERKLFIPFVKFHTHQYACAPYIFGRVHEWQANKELDVDSSQK